MQLARWVAEERVVVPLSSGHMLETTKWADHGKRRAVALSLLTITRGWSMRDPLHVRRDELHDLFRRELADGTGQRERPVFTLDPDSRWGEDREFTGYRAPPEFAGGLAFFVEMIVAAQVTVSVLLDPEAVEVPTGRMTPGWVEVNQKFSEKLNASGESVEKKRRATDALVALDMAKMIQEESTAAGLPSPAPGELARLMDERAFWKPPFLGLYREVMHERHVNQQPGRGVRWKRGDLWDMTYLGCAAAYADIVVCERSATYYLTRAIGRRLGGARVFSSLVQAVDHVQGLLGEPVLDVDD